MSNFQQLCLAARKLLEEAAICQVDGAPLTANKQLEDAQEHLDALKQLAKADADSDALLRRGRDKRRKAQ